MRSTILQKAANACARILCAALAVFAFLSLICAQAADNGVLRVKLARLGSPSAITMRADCDYTVVGDDPFQIPAGTEMTVSASGGALTLTADGRTVSLGNAAHLSRSASGSKGMAFTAPALSNRFCGDLVLSTAGDAITAVLRIYIEDYLYGVVGYEMSPSSHLEALKAQAIAARNYALRQKNSRSASGYDLSDSGDALSFRGYSAASEYANVLRAVDETRGQVLYYGNDPAACYFCDSNGGQTESAANALGTSLAYTRVMDDPYDFDGAGIKKTASLRKDGANLDPALASALIQGASDRLAGQGVSDLSGVRITAIEDVVPESPRFTAPSRLYQSLVVSAAFAGETQLGQTATVRATVRVPTYDGVEDWYDLGINDADNETVWVTETNRAFEVTFRRNGTGVGMSQRGAQVMAKKGLSCETILDYYYPGTALRTVELADAAPGGAAAAKAARPTSARPIASARLSRKSRLYTGADTASPALTTLPAGVTVTVYAVQDAWAAIGSGDMYGYIQAETLTSYAPAGVAVIPVRDETLARVNGGPVAVLQLPVEGAATLASLLGGDRVRLMAYTDAWAQITTEDGVEGFVKRDSLSAVDETADPPAQSVEGGAITVAKGHPWRYVAEETLTLYESYDAASPALATLKQGDRVRLGAYNDVWACVRAKGMTGFVRLKGLSETPVKTVPDVEGGAIVTVKGVKHAVVALENAPMYPSWSEVDAPIALLMKGDQVRIGAYNQAWACVRVDGVTGFMRVDALEYDW